MRNNLLMLSLLLFLLSSCQDKEDNTEADYIELAQKEITFDYRTGKDTIKLKTNTSWEIENVPEWLTVSKQKGAKEDTDIVIIVQKNSQNETREFELTFQTKDKKETVRIFQEVKPKVEYTLPRLGFTSLNRLVSGTYSETEPFDLEFEADKLFINSLNKELIFLGSLFQGNLIHYPKLDRIETAGYTFNHITVAMPACSDCHTQESFIPSYEAYQKLEKESLDNFTSNSNLSFSTSNVEYYYSRRHLHCIGLYELGVSLEKLLNGKSYKEESMKHEYGLIYPVAQVRFASFMDIPNPSLLTKELKKDKFVPLQPNYIAGISYGNNALLLVESDFDKGTVNALKSKLSKNEQLNADEVKKAEQIDAYYLYLVSAGEFKVIQGNLIEVVNELSSIKPIIVPVGFSFSDYYDNGVGTVKYKIHVD